MARARARETWNVGLARGLATKPASCFRSRPTCVLMDQAVGDEQVIQVDNGQAIKIGVGIGDNQSPHERFESVTHSSPCT